MSVRELVRVRRPASAYSRVTAFDGSRATRLTPPPPRLSLIGVREERGREGESLPARPRFTVHATRAVCRVL